jgi:heavy metal sensor kinase
MSNNNKVLKIVKQIAQVLIVIIIEILKIIRVEIKKIYNSVIEKFHFSLTFKLTIVYARKTLSILMLLGLFIIGGFIIFSGWMAQENMKTDLNLVMDYLKEGGPSEEKIERLTELDNLSITLFNEEGNILFTTESDNSNVVFYDRQNPTGGFNINSNYILVRNQSPVNYNLRSALKGEDNSFGYAMILLEEIQWDDTSVQVQIKNRMVRENASLLVLILILFGIDILLVFAVVKSGAKSSRRILKPIEVMTNTVENITINELNTRLDVSGSQDELKDLARTFNGMLDRIQESYEQQNQFVSDASHELRTPISIIHGYTELLDRWGKKDEKILEESLGAIKGETKNMKELVEKLLFLARGDKNTQKIEKEDFYLNELIDNIVKETKMIDSEHEIINARNDKITINADFRLLKEALRIFIDNGIKYTPSGGSIKIESTINENEVQISIEDTGIGISKEDLPYIFNRFYRADKARNKEIEGTGLGLSIANWIIESHSGRIKVQSEINIGTKVIINLPIQ